jgi:hypothetical protein
MFVSHTYEGSVLDKAIAEDVPYCLPAGNKLLEDLGFQCFTMDEVRHTKPHRNHRVEN